LIHCLFSNAGKIEYTKAKVIARVADEETRTQLLEAAIANSLSQSNPRTSQSRTSTQATVRIKNSF